MELNVRIAHTPHGMTASAFHPDQERTLLACAGDTLAESVCKLLAFLGSGGDGVSPVDLEGLRRINIEWPEPQNSAPEPAQEP